jgi:putative endonuclease
MSPAEPPARRRSLGDRAEELAAEHLRAKGYKIVARNWRRPEGELDIVVLDGCTCVFVEVRSRTGTDRGHPLETVNRDKRAKIVRAAQLYLQSEHSEATDYRFDVVGVTFPTEGGSPELIYVADAFRAP